MAERPMSEPLISVVIPFLNEEGSLNELHSRLTTVLGNMCVDYELIFVDDGSRDRSNSIVLALKSKDSRVRLITLRRNQGKSAALSIGFQASRGDFVVTMDADLQDDPSEIPNLKTKIEEGFDLVSG
jgi:glycosyltransferase involved in cell wall biosynthesis